MIKYLYTFFFVWERNRYYWEPASSCPTKITQEYWDEMHELRDSIQMDYEKSKSVPDGQRVFLFVDTTFGTGREDFDEKMGQRPRVPTVIKNIRLAIFFIIDFIALIFIIGLLFGIIKHS